MPEILPVAKQQFRDADGRALRSGRLYTYAAGTSTPKAAYRDVQATDAHANPIILDATGSATIYWSGAYKVVLKGRRGNVIWSVDNYNDPTTPNNLTTETLSNLVSLSQEETLPFTVLVNAPLSEHRYVWGDGAADIFPETTAASSRSHTYATPGTRTVVLETRTSPVSPWVTRASFNVTAAPKPAPISQAPAPIPLPVVDFYATIVTVAPIPAPPPVGAPPPAVAPYSGTFDLYRNGIALQTDALLMAQVPPDRRMFVDSPVTLTLVPQDTRITSGTINWGDGSALENYTAGQTASHTFSPGNASNFTVTFTGTTPDGVVFGYRYLYVEAIPAPAPPPNVPRIASAAFVPSVLNVGQSTSLTINFAGLTPGATSTMAYTVIGQTGLTGYFGDATRVVTADAAGNAFAVEPYTAAATGQAQVSHGVQVSGLASYVLASLTVNDPAVSSPTPPPPPPPPPPPVFASFTGPGGVVGAGEQFDVSLTITGLPANAVAPISASFGASPRLSGPVGQTVTLTANANAAGTAVVPVQFGVIASAPTSQATLSATCQGVVRSTVIEIEAAPPVGGGGLGPEGTA